MRTSTLERNRQWETICSGWRGLPLLALCLLFPAFSAPAQNGGEQSVAQRIQQLTDAMARVQAQMDDSERQLALMKKQLDELRTETSQGQADPTGAEPAQASSSDSASALSAAVQGLREREAVTESQVATLEQDKVESDSKYPVRITGMVLMNGFVNRGAVDMPATPTLALPGTGDAGASLRQTVMGVDAEGPHLFGARSYADLSTDFYGGSGTATGTGYAGYYNKSAPLRLRTAHAELEWQHAQAYFSLDRPIVSPNTPTSLTAVAVPALAWSGNLWTWNPQAGVNAYFRPMDARGVEVQAALIDTGDAPLTPPSSASSSASISPTSAEASSKPGVEARIALLGAIHDGNRDDVGVGGYFAPHDELGGRYDSWAATIDERLLLPMRLQMTGSLYRGSALGGLGGGAYKDYVYETDFMGGGYFRALDDAGGWAQLKDRFSERVEANGAVGLDDAFAGELRPNIAPGGSFLDNLARNRTYTGNVIYRPSAYLLFSFEFRHIESVPVSGAAASSNVFGAAAGYKF